MANRQKEETPEIMLGNEVSANKIKMYMEDVRKPSVTQEDLTKFKVMEGMQSEKTNKFFTEYTDFDDVLRMNTIEMFTYVAPLIVRKTSEKNREKIQAIMDSVYRKHVTTHKENMTSLNRKREASYTKILSHDTTEEVIPTGVKKFFFGGGNGKA